MSDLQKLTNDYLRFCEFQKRLDSKTLKAYRIDLEQFAAQLPSQDLSAASPAALENYIARMHRQYKPKTVKRKIASLKAFFRYLEYRELLNKNPFNRIQTRFREPAPLPKTIPLHVVKSMLDAVYRQQQTAKTAYQRKNALRDAAVIEVLFSTGMRISELCALHINDVDLYDRSILIHGKGAKERIIQIVNSEVIHVLEEYLKIYHHAPYENNYFFINQNGKVLSDQAVRRMINKYSALAESELHITPHMFRHTFATSLLEADVDIRYIQEMLGHSSINITEIYTHVTLSKQRNILADKHPRKDFHMSCRL